MVPFDVDQGGWDSLLGYDDDSWFPWNPDKFVVHWGGGSYTIPEGIVAEKSQLRGWQRYHMNTKGWLDIAYNYAIGQSGTIYRLRGENRAGATRGDFEDDGIPENHEARAVVFIINVGQAPSAAALAAFQRLYSADPMPVIGHKWVHEQGTGGTLTACPGPDLDAWLHAKGYLMPTYRDVLNVEPWEEGAYDWAIDSGMVNTGDEFTDDARRMLDDGRFWNLLKRYHDRFPTVAAAAIAQLATNLDETDARLADAELVAHALQGLIETHDHNYALPTHDHQVKGETI